MIRCAFLSSFSSRAFRRSSLRTFSSSGFRSGLRPRFFDRAFSDPLCAALRHVVRCDEKDLTHLAGLGAPVRFFDVRSLYDGLNRRRSGLSTTSGSEAAALRLASPVPEVPTCSVSLEAALREVAEVGEVRNLSTTMGHSTGLIREQCPVW